MLLILAILVNGIKTLILIPANNYTQSHGRKMLYSLICWLSSLRPPLPEELNGATAAFNREIEKVVFFEFIVMILTMTVEKAKSNSH